MNEILELDLPARAITTEFTPPTYSIVFTNQGAQVNVPMTSTSNALALDADTAAWVFEAAKKLDSLGKLRRNWDSYDGLPLSPGAKRITFDALGWLKHQDLPVPAVVLGSGGTVHLEWYSNGKELELGFGESNRMEFCKIDSHGHVEEGDEDQDICSTLTILTEWLRIGS
jgi:hypothetical protein